MIAILVVTLYVGSVVGQGGHQNSTNHHMFEGLDANGDGTITQLEMTADFHRLDQNGNGKVSRHEYTEYVCRTSPEAYNFSHFMYDMFDLDNDHVLSLQDYLHFFTNMDTDGDGVANYDDFYTASWAAFTDYIQNELHHELHDHGHSQCH